MPNEPALYAIVVAMLMFFLGLWVKSVRDDMKRLKETYVSDVCCKERRKVDEEKCQSIAKTIEDSVERVREDVDEHVHVETNGNSQVQYRRRK